MIRKIANKISKRYVLISLILVGLIGLFMIFVFMGYFLDMANGYPYMETKLGFLPDDLFEMAEGYGAAGRSLYIKSALSLDLLVPLARSQFSNFPYAVSDEEERWRGETVWVGMYTGIGVLPFGLA